MKTPEQWSKNYNRHWRRGCSLDVADGDYSSIEMFIAAIQKDAVAQSKKERMALRRLLKLRHLTDNTDFKDGTDLLRMSAKWVKAWKYASKVIKGGSS